MSYLFHKSAFCWFANFVNINPSHTHFKPFCPGFKCKNLRNEGSKNLICVNKLCRRSSVIVQSQHLKNLEASGGIPDKLFSVFLIKIKFVLTGFFSLFHHLRQLLLWSVVIKGKNIFSSMIKYRKGYQIPKKK